MRRSKRSESKELKLLKGNPSKENLNDIVVPPPKLPKCPTWLDKEGKKEWKRISKDLFDLGLLTNIDMAALAIYCQTFSRWLECEQFISQFGYTYEDTYTGKNGDIFHTTKVYPQVGFSQKYTNLLTKYIAMFGLSPGYRGNLIGSGKEEKKSKMNSFLSG